MAPHEHPQTRRLCAKEMLKGRMLRRRLPHPLNSALVARASPARCGGCPSVVRLSASQPLRALELPARIAEPVPTPALPQPARHGCRRSPAVSQWERRCRAARGRASAALGTAAARCLFLAGLRTSRQRSAGSQRVSLLRQDWVWLKAAQLPLFLPSPSRLPATEPEHTSIMPNGRPQLQTRGTPIFGAPGGIWDLSKAAGLAFLFRKSLLASDKAGRSSGDEARQPWEAPLLSPPTSPRLPGLLPAPAGCSAGSTALGPPRNRRLLHPSTGNRSGDQKHRTEPTAR